MCGIRVIVDDSGWFPSPHSGILFLYSANSTAKGYQGGESFRPLIRGFFFYKLWRDVPPLYAGCFRPLIRGFFFYNKISLVTAIINLIVSVPSFGDSFFINPLRPPDVSQY